MNRIGRHVRPLANHVCLLLATTAALGVQSPADAKQAELHEQANRVAGTPEPGLFIRLDEIVVTARRLPEPLQTIPVSVVSLTDEDLEARSVTNLRDLQNFVPNLTYAPSQNVGEAAGNIFIRGIGQEDFVPGTEPGVGLYLDGVYVARTLGALMNLTDIARVEVLRGPQGTLFGRNTIGGAINVVSRKPEQTPGGSVGLILGSFERVEVRAILNQPLSESLSARLSVGAVSRNGYLRRLPAPPGLAPFSQVNSAPEGADRSQAGRLQLRLRMSESLTLDFSLDGSRRRNGQSATHIDGVDPQVGILRDLNRLIREGRLPGPEITDDIRPESLLESHASGDSFTHQDIWGASIVFTNAFAGAELKFIGAYRAQRSRVRTDIDGLYFDINRGNFPADEQHYSAELQITGNRGRLSYTSGLFFLGERSRRIPGDGAIPNFIRATCACLFSPVNLPRSTEPDIRFGGNSFAGYFQATYELANRLSATLGARYSHERKTLDVRLRRLNSELQLTDIIVATGTNEGTWDPFTWRAGLEYQVKPDLMVYGSVAKGFKSGGFNSRAVETLPNLGLIAFRPEIALTYEVGLRSQWFGNRLRFNATLFHTDYRDLQLRQQTIVGSQVTTLIDNAARARIRGLEVELTAIPLEGVKLSAAYGHLDPRYLDVDGVSELTLLSQFQRSPRHSVTASLHYSQILPSGDLSLHADVSYRSREQFQIASSPYDQSGYALLGARITYQPRGHPWSFALFGTNLTDARYRVAGRDLTSQAGFAYSTIALPRQLGIEVRSEF